MKHSQESHSSAGYHNMTVVLFTLLCVLICGFFSLSLKAQTKTSDEQVTPNTVPDRNGKIAFTSTQDGGGIYTIEADGSNQTRLTPGASPKWSPDGTKIAFLRSTGFQNGFQYDIYVMNADGSNQTRLTNNLVIVGRPDWSPDGSRIVFQSNRDAGNWEIYVMNADGTNQTRLTNDPGRDDSPKWSPDGTRIVFERLRIGVSIWEIHVMSADGSNQTQLTNSGRDFSPRWSPDSSRIAFFSTRDDPSPSTCGNCNFEIYVMNADGSNQTRLTNNPSLDASPEWSPDGTRIVFRSLRGDYNVNIYVMNADGTSQTRLTNYTEGNDVVSPIFSPDGRRIMFSYGYDFAGELITSQSYVMNADGSNLVRLTNAAADAYEIELDWQALPQASPSCPNSIDCAEFFVRQHYLDFLNREPDPAGMAAWLAVLNTCLPGDTACDRIHVSSAFFRSPEFQERGYFLYRFYSVAFGRKPDFNEFTPDLAKVSGFLTDAELEAAKLAFITEFMSRPAFLSKFNGLSNTEYVDTLLLTADINHPNRDTWIAALTNGSRTGAQVLREIAESTEVYNKYYNQAFVVMQYFGYLRRQPDALYLNWIAHLDGTGDYRSMTHGFMNSIEYRARFGQP